jgi:hypothetical protein
MIMIKIIKYIINAVNMRDIDIIVSVRKEDFDYINRVIAQGTINPDNAMREFAVENNIGKVNVTYKFI